MNIPNFEELLDWHLRQRGWTQKELAKRANMTDRNLSVQKKKKPEISEKFARKIFAGLGISQEEFLLGGADGSPEYYPIPLREASAGMGGGSAVGSRRILSYVSIQKSLLLTKTSNLEKLSFVNANGNSMSPTIPDGSIVLIDEGQTEPINGKIFFVMHNSDYLIKRLRVKDGRVVALISDNENVKDVELGEQEKIEVLGKAILQQTWL